MPLVVRLTTSSPFKDSCARAAMARYCDQQNWEYQFGDRYAKVDMFAKKPDGIYIGLELLCNACWTMQSEYSKSYVHVPRRKWPTFYYQTYDIPTKDICRADRAYLVVFNTEYTRAAIINFPSMLKFSAIFDMSVMDIHDKLDIFVHVPTLYIQKYIDIPPERKEILV